MNIILEAPEAHGASLDQEMAELLLLAIQSLSIYDKKQANSIQENLSRSPVYDLLLLAVGSIVLFDENQAKFIANQYKSIISNLSRS